jgi:hypothetical protein
MSLPRSEYPRPQWTRSDWLTLNEEWEFAEDPRLAGEGVGAPRRAWSGVTGPRHRQQVSLTIDGACTSLQAEVDAFAAPSPAPRVKIMPSGRRTIRRGAICRPSAAAEVRPERVANRCVW